MYVRYYFKTTTLAAEKSYLTQEFDSRAFLSFYQSSMYRQFLATLTSVCNSVSFHLMWGKLSDTHLNCLLMVLTKCGTIVGSKTTSEKN
jgi:hypothetical protein